MEKLQKFIMSLKKQKKLLLILVAFLMVVVFGWQRFISSKVQQPQYQTAQVEKGIIVSTVSASGQIMLANIINITTQASGGVKQVFVSEGDKVVAGQNIAEIELDLQGLQRNASAWSSYLSAKNNLETAQINLNTLNSQMWSTQQKFIKDAVARGLATDDPTYIQQNSDWLAAEAKYKNQQAIISQVQAALNSAWFSFQTTSPIITAPIAGKINNITAVAGITISSQGESAASSKIATIRNENNPLASFNLSEIDVVRVKIGQKATLTLDSISGKTFTGKVVGVDRVGQVTNGVTSYPAVIQLDTKAEGLLPNMAASVSIIIDSKDNVLLVPSQAVQILGGQNIVRVLRGSQVQEVPVEVGLSSETQIEITSGVSEGEEVITGSISSSGQQQGSSFFGGLGGFGGGALRPGGAGGGTRR